MMWYSIPRQTQRKNNMATRLERLEESLEKAHVRVTEIEANIAS